MTTAVRLEVRRGSALVGSAVVALEIVALLVAAHLLAGGRLPGLPWIVAMVAVTFAAGVPAVKGAVPGWVVAPGLVATQLGLHLWLDHLTPAGTNGSIGTATGATHAHLDHVHLSAPMLAAHVAAGLVGALLWELRRRAVDVLVHVHRTSGSLIPLSRRWPALVVVHVFGLLGRLTDSAPRRGPPVALPAT